MIPNKKERQQNMDSSTVDSQQGIRLKNHPQRLNMRLICWQNGCHFLKDKRNCYNLTKQQIHLKSSLRKSPKKQAQPQKQSTLQNLYLRSNENPKSVLASRKK